MGQGKAKQSKGGRDTITPLVDWNFNQQPEVTTLDTRSCLFCGVTSKTIVDISLDKTNNEYSITTRDINTLSIIKQQSLSSLGLDNLESSLKTPVSLSVLKDTLVVVGTGASGFIARWNAKQQAFTKATLFRGNKEGFIKVTLFGEKLFATVSAEFIVKIWDTEKNSCVSTLTANKQESYCVAFNDSNGQLSIGGREGLLLVYDSRNLGFQPKKMEIDKTGKYGISALCYNSESNKLAIGLLLWSGPLNGSLSNSSSGRKGSSSSPSSSPLLSSSSSSQSILSSSTSAKTSGVSIKIFNMESYLLEMEWKAHKTDIVEMQWVGGIIATCDKEPFIFLWNAASGEKLMEIALPSSSPLAFRFDPFSQGLIVATQEGLLGCKMALLTSEEKTSLAAEREKKEEEAKQIILKHEEDEKLRLRKEEERKQKKRQLQKSGVSFAGNAEEEENEEREKREVIQETSPNQSLEQEKNKEEKEEVVSKDRTSD